MRLPQHRLAYGRGNPDIRRSEVGSLDILTSHLYMWQAGRRQRTSQPLVQEKYPRHQRHSMLNDIIWRAIKRAQISAHKEPTRLITYGGKRPDGVTLMPWSKGKPLAWDVTVPDIFAVSHISMTSLEAGDAARQAASTKNTKHIDIISTHIFYPIAKETAGSWDVQALEVIEEIGKRVTEATENPKETMYLFRDYQWPFRGVMRCHSSTPSTKTTSMNPSQSTIFPII